MKIKVNKFKQIQISKLSYFIMLLIFRSNIQILEKTVILDSSEEGEILCVVV